MSEPDAEHELRLSARRGEREAIDLLLAELVRARSDARAWAAVQISAAPAGLLADVLSPLLNSGPHPSAAAYAFYCAVAEDPKANAWLADIVWERCVAIAAAAGEESRGVMHYGLRLVNLLQRFEHPLLDMIRLHGDAELRVEAATLVVDWNLDRLDWADRLVGIRGPLEDQATILRLQLGHAVAPAVAKIACAQGPWCFAACDALEAADARDVASTLMAAGSRRFLVRPVHPRLVAAAWALGAGEAGEWIRAWLKSRNVQVRAIARSAWLRLAPASAHAEALGPASAADDAWLLEDLLQRRFDAPSPALRTWVLTVRDAHPDPECRELAQKVQWTWSL